MKYTARSVSLTYLPNEDRIRWASRCEDGTLVVVWVARRHLTILLPRLAEWLDRQSSLRLQALAPEETRKELRQFEHQAAQQRVKSVRTLARKQVPDVEFLLNYCGVNVIGNGFYELLLVAPDDTLKISLPLGVAQLHKIVRELLEVGNAAGWGVPDPWPSPQESVPVARRTRH